MSMYKMLTADIVMRSPLGDVGLNGAPHMTGAVADFLGLLVQATAAKSGGEFADIATYLEKHLLSGSIRVAGREFPEITYAFGKRRLQMSEASSMVTEVAPLVLFFRQLAWRGRLLVLEEPEAHLHPALQRRMARVIARAVNAGVRIILTTHSDYFINQINNLIRVSSLGRQELDAQGFLRSECLNAEQVNAYVFKATRPGTRVVAMKTTTDGFPESEFEKVSEALYGETVDLRMALLPSDA
jgi:predicted ATPase